MNETLSLNDLTPDSKNARQHTDRNVGMIADALREVGAARSIVVDEQGNILAGNATVKAAVEAGIEHVQVVDADGSTLVAVRRSGLSDAEKIRLAIFDNRTAELADWNEERLAEILAEDERLLDGLFSKDELAEVLGDLLKPEAVDDPGAQVDKAAELQEKWGTALGQVWEVGDHRIVCGDCTDGAAVEAVMRGERADLLWTDPPYNVDYKGNYIQSGQILPENEKIWQDGMGNDALEDFGAWLQSAYQVIDPFLSKGCAIYIWHPPGAEGRHFWKAWLWDKWHFQVDLVWNKLSLIISRWDYKPQHEPFMYGWKGSSRKWAGANNEPTVWDLPRQQGRSGDERYHPTQKFPELARRCIENHDAQIVLDPFLGSGTTAVACQQLGRKCRGIEISPAYTAVAIQRLADMGLTPNLL